ncbi:MAG: hypothetical protein ACLU37_07195 [Collinsella sp.]
MATDLFALAALVFRMLGNGVHPFEGAVEPDAEGEYPLPPAVDCQVRDGRSPFTRTAPGVGLFAGHCRSTTFRPCSVRPTLARCLAGRWCAAA